MSVALALRAPTGRVRAASARSPAHLAKHSEGGFSEGHVAIEVHSASRTNVIKARRVFQEMLDPHRVGGRPRIDHASIRQDIVHDIVERQLATLLQDQDRPRYERLADAADYRLAQRSRNARCRSLASGSYATCPPIRGLRHCACPPRSSKT